MPATTIGYLNGSFAPLDGLCIPVLDRGFIFGDGIYEVIPVYHGRLFRAEQHLERLERSLAAVRIPSPLTRERWLSDIHELVERNGGGFQAVYLQVTRGVAERNHAFPRDVVPTVFMMTRAIAADRPMQIMKAVTRPDDRWLHCDIKSTSLLPNVLLRQRAVDAGADEVVLIRDGWVSEGAATNVFAVQEEFVVTPPKSDLILHGVTRDFVVELLESAGIPCVEAALSEDGLRAASEIWLTSSTTEVAAVVELDGTPVGGARPGLVTTKAFRLFQEFKRGLDPDHS